MSESFTPYVAGQSLPQGSAPASSAHNVPRTGGETNPSAAALKDKFGGAVTSVVVGWGETTVIVETARVHEVIQWLKDDQSQRYDRYRW